jgi:hypothetical protein
MKLDIKFMPGAFDDFEGTQEELDAVIAELTATIQEMYDRGELGDGEELSAEGLVEFESGFPSSNTRH